MIPGSQKVRSIMEMCRDVVRALGVQVWEEGEQGLGHSYR